MKIWLMVAGMMLGVCGLCLAQHETSEHAAGPAGPAAATSPAAHVAAAEEIPHPEVSEDAAWTRPVLLIIFAMFAAAVPVGIVIRARSPKEAPAPHDDGHGHGGHGGHDDGHGGHHAAHGGHH